MATNVLSSRIAASVPIKPRHRRYGANIQQLAKHVAGIAGLTASITALVPQHWRLPLLVIRRMRDSSFDPWQCLVGINPGPRERAVGKPKEPLGDSALRPMEAR